MFHLIGVDHRVQAKPKGAELSQEQQEFSTCLADAIKAIKPRLIAEEYNQLALEMCAERTGVEHESVTEYVARTFGIEHRFCDPDRTARDEMEYMEGEQIAMQLEPTGHSPQEIIEMGLAIEIAKHWPKREGFWLAQVGAQIHEDVVFVAGDCHVDSFRELLKKNGINSSVLALHIGVLPTDDDGERFERAKAYLAAHPEICE